MDDSSIAQKITQVIETEITQLSGHLYEWAREHVIAPKKIVLANDADGKEYAEYWLVTDHTGHNDSSYRVIYDDEFHLFGLACRLQTGVVWCLGLYGSFAETINNM